MHLSFLPFRDIKQLRDMDRSLNSILRNCIICEANSHMGSCEDDYPSLSHTKTEYSKYMQYTLHMYEDYRKYAKSRHPNDESFSRDRYKQLRVNIESGGYPNLLEFYFFCISDYCLRNSFDNLLWREFKQIIEIFIVSSYGCILSRNLKNLSNLYKKLWPSFHDYIINKYNDNPPYPMNDYYISELEYFFMSEFYFRGLFPYVYDANLQFVISDCCSSHIDYCRGQIRKDSKKLINVSLGCLAEDEQFNRSETENWLENSIRQSKNTISIFKDLLNFIEVKGCT